MAIALSSTQPASAPPSRGRVLIAIMEWPGFCLDHWIANALDLLFCRTIDAAEARDVLWSNSIFSSGNLSREVQEAAQTGLPPDPRSLRISTQ